MNKKTMRTSCLISNYNYGQFILEAVYSALNQTVKFDEIIIVDDASTDNSAEIISQLAQEANAQYSKVKCVLQTQNQGQLSCFNEAFSAATGDLIFFLDADDIYESEYLEKALTFYQRHRECDFLFCGYKKFGAAEGTFQNFGIDLDLGYSVIRTLYDGEWIGSITSTLSMRREVLRKVLPIPHLEDWRVRADDCLIWGASLVGAKKFYMSEALIMYRIHESNNFHNSKFVGRDKNHEYRRFWQRNSLFNYIMQKNTLALPLFLAFNSLNELGTIPCPKLKDFIVYLKIIFLFENNLYWKVKGMVLLLSHLLRQLMSGKLKVA